ncbi:hypothetical protein RN001_002839 [Aquatica leii]|uniref:Protein SPT2 homolog n=1 Tax=Aquatica leii TaxID=1421715 RepID=A0AAN7PHR5_9COLE|nr:hypothetical protein RN001_002839 [Aquatica leii]
MDFGSLLRTAKENGQLKKDVRVYNTKFTPPKKEEKKSKTLSANIQKFLARKEAEEKNKQLEASRKRDELLALRSKDKKATRRVNVMLKRTKSANQSVIADAVDKDNTSVTLAGPSQPDEDDYGYVSQEAADFYNKMMEKYNKIPDDPKFPFAKKRASNNLIGTKDRVKAALEKEREEALLPHKRKRKHTTEEVEPEKQNENDDTPPPVKTKPKLPPPPIMNFNDLLKLAAVKQHEPIMIEVKPKEEEGPLLTKKQKKELEKEQQRKSQKVLQQSINNKIPPSKPTQLPQTETKIKKIGDNNNIPQKPIVKNLNPHNQELKPKTNIQNSRLQPPLSVPSKVPSIKQAKLNDIKRELELPNGSSKSNSVSKTTPKPIAKHQQKPVVTKDDAQRKHLGINYVKEKSNFTQKSVQSKEFPPKDLKPKLFPPPDVGRRPPPVQQKQKFMKRRIIDDDDEYDSEMDDFIDDGPEETNDYSRYIKDIFGYDKHKYRCMDDDDVDNMESSFAQQMREDVRSTKLGIMEDLEDIKREKEEKKRKAMVMKRRKL